MLSFEVLERDGIPAARAATECDEFSVEVTAADTVIDTAASGLLYTSNALDAHRPVTWMILSDAPSFINATTNADVSAADDGAALGRPATGVAD